jgi:hypothetical protein
MRENVATLSPYRSTDSNILHPEEVKWQTVGVEINKIL